MTYESSLPSNGDVCQAVLLEDSLLRKPLGQRTPPPPSPLLSELLKKGSALPGNPRPVGLHVHSLRVRKKKKWSKREPIGKKKKNNNI